MRYTGYLRIVNELNGVVFERELSSHETIEMLLENASVPPPPAFIPTDAVKEEKPRKVKKEKPAPATRAAGAGCNECGSKGKRHKNGCSKAGGYAKKHEKPASVDFGRILSREEYDIVQDLKENSFKNSAQILSELPDEINIQQVNWASILPNYEKYKEHATKPR